MSIALQKSLPLNTVRVYLGVGSNIKNPLLQIKQAISSLSLQEGVWLHQVSALYRSKPWGGVTQPDFINVVASIETTLPPQQLLCVLQTIESSQGRVRDIPWGPRTIDLDILLFGQEIIQSAFLEIPHPRMLQRDFVVFPLAELAPTLQLPTGELLLDYTLSLSDNGLHRLFAFETL